MELEAILSRLIAICRDSEQGYRHASEIVGEEDLSHFFDQQASTRALAAQAIEDQLDQSGGRAEARVLCAPPTEGWSWPANNDNDPEAVIAACYRGEERAVEAYQQALGNLPEDWRWLIREQCQMMRSALAKLHTWITGKGLNESRSRS